MAKIKFEYIFIIEPKMEFLYIGLTKQCTDCTNIQACPNYDNNYTLKHNFIGAN